MPRAHRDCLPHHIWHPTHRCHQRDLLLKVARDRWRRRQWLFEGTKRYRLCVLDDVVTSNHIHLVVRDHGRGEIAASSQYAPRANPPSACIWRFLSSGRVSMGVSAPWSGYRSVDSKCL